MRKDRKEKQTQGQTFFFCFVVVTREEISVQLDQLSNQFKFKHEEIEQRKSNTVGGFCDFQTINELIGR